MEKQRDITFDVMKGIAILAMVAGHCVIPEIMLRFIYMWHMPLFFIVSGYFYRSKQRKEVIKSSLKGLLNPYFFAFVAVAVLIIFLKPENFTHVLYGFLGILGWFHQGNDVYYGGNGPLWFLPALFWCRIVYDEIRRVVRSKYLIWGGIVILSFMGVYVGHRIFIPFFIAQGLAALIFYHIGSEAKRLRVKNQKIHGLKWMFVIAFVLAGLFTDTMYFYTLQFPCWILNVVSASCATFLLYQLCVRIVKGKLVNILSYVGRASLLLLCAHGIDYVVGLTKEITALLPVSGKVYFLSYNICLFAIALVGMVALSKSRFVRSTFGIK